MDRPDSRPEPGDQDLREVSIDWQPGDDTRRPLWPMTIAMVAVVAILGAGIAVASARGGSGDGPDRDEAAVVDADEASDDSNGRTPLIDTINPLGPRDGLDSKRHPVAVTPPDQLLDGQEVTVSGSQFPPGTALGIVMCSGAVDLGGGAAQCQLSPFTQVSTDAGGNFETLFPVRRIILIGGEEVDCAAPTPEGLDSTCVVAVGALDDYDESGIAPVWFDASVPAPPPPEMTVSPATDLEHLEMVTITLTGIDEEMYWWPQLCAQVDGAMGNWDDEWCDQVGWWDHMDEPFAPAMEGHGSNTITVPVQRIVAPYSENPIDCAEAPGRCVIRVWAGPRPLQPVPLSFDPSFAAPPLPELQFPPHPTVVTPTDTTEPPALEPTEPPGTGTTEPPAPASTPPTSMGTDTTFAPPDP